MLDEHLQDQAVAYVSGALTAAERESLEVVLEYHQELRAQVAGLQEVVAMAALLPATRAEPPADLKDRVLAAAAAEPVPAEPEALVVTDPQGLTLWVNPAFTAMCGYSLAELQGRKPGHLLQGAATEAAAVRRIREALAARRPCRETLVNYHKDGTRYRAEVSIAPVLADNGEPLWFVAKERKVAESARAGRG